MSAYVSRLLRRYAAGPLGREGASEGQLAPSVRSRSPIAALDQRLSVADEPSYGLDAEGSAQPAVDGHGDSPSPGERVQRKATSPVAAGPTVGRGATAPGPVGPVGPVGEIPAAPTATSLGPNPSAAASVSAFAGDGSDALGPQTRPPPMDPGPLFDPTPRSREDAPDPLERAPARPIAFQPAPPRRESIPSPSQPTVSPRARGPRPGVDDGTDRVSTPISPRVHPFEPVELAPTSQPTTQPTGQPTSQPAMRVEPRLAPPRAFVPDTPAHLVGSSAPTRVSIGRVDIEVVPATTNPSASAAPSGSAQSTAPARAGRLSIDSVSVIGPLDPHFPNRRRFRLRYR